MSQAGITFDAAFRATHPAQAACPHAWEQLDSTWICLLVNSLTISSLWMHYNIIFFCLMLSRLILLYLIIYQYVIHEFSSAVLLPALPDFRTKSVCPVVDVSLAGTTLDAAFRATHPGQASCDHIDISTYLCIYISIYLYIYISIYLYIHISIYLYIYIYIYLYIYIARYIYLSIYLYIRARDRYI